MKLSRAKEKVAYLRGLTDGQNITDEQQRKLYTAMIDALDAIANELEDHAAAIEDIDESVVDLYDAIDEMDELLEGDEEEEEDDDPDFMEITCPHCKEQVFFDHDMIVGDDLICPACNEKINILETLHTGEEESD